MLSGRTLLAGAILVAAVIAVIFFIGDPPSPALLKNEPSATRETLVPDVSIPALGEDGARPTPQMEQEAPVAAAATDDVTENDMAFRADAAGQLVLDEQTRLNIETLIAQSASQELYAAVREQTEALPPSAARQAEELVHKFANYQEAQRQTFPPDDAPFSMDDAVTQLEGLHALREAHFGPEVARRFYGKEEAIAREMIEVMRVENDESLTPQEKLERAQALREQLPEVAAIERRNRESAAKQEPPPKTETR